MEKLPVRFNPADLARSGRATQITLPVSHFARFSAMLADDSGEVHIVAKFGWTEDRLPVAVGSQTSTTNVTCQRCQKAMTSEFSSEFALVFIASEADAAELADDIDPVVMGDIDDIHVVDFIEDELILQMPARVVHEVESDCDPAVIAAVSGDQTQDKSGEKDTPAGTHNPFKGLDELLKN